MFLDKPCNSIISFIQQDIKELSLFPTGDDMEMIIFGKDRSVSAILFTTN